MATANRVIKNTGFLYAKMGITIFISLYSTRLILNGLGVDDFGIFNVVGGSIAMLLFFNNAMAAASQRFISFTLGEGNIDKLKSVFVVSVVLHFLIGLLIVIILEVVGFFLFDGILNIPEDRVNAAMFIYQFLIVSSFFTIISVPYDASINAHEDMFFVAVLGIVQSILKLAIAISIAYVYTDKLIYYGALMASLSILIMIIKRIFCHKKYIEINYRLKENFSKDLFKEMSSFAGWNIFQSATRVLSMQGMAIVLNSFFGVFINAAQGVANQINGQLMAFSNTMLKALNPAIVKSEGAKQRDVMLKASIAGSKISFFLFAFFSIPFIIKADFILEIWLGEVPDYAVIFCRLLLVVTCIKQLSVTLYTAIASTGRIKEISITEGTLLIFLLPTSILLFNLGYSAEVIYYALIFIETCVGGARIWYAHRFCDLPIKFYLKNVVLLNIVIYLSTIIITYSLISLLEEDFIQLIITVILSSILLIPSIIFIVLSEEERSLMKNFMKGVLNKVKK